MQRPLYPVLLVCASFIAIIICLRPSVGVELLTLAETWSDTQTETSVPTASAPLGDAYGIAGGAPTYPTQGVRPGSWPGSASADDSTAANTGQYDPRYDTAPATGSQRNPALYDNLQTNRSQGYTAPQTNPAYNPAPYGAAQPATPQYTDPRWATPAPTAPATGAPDYVGASEPWPPRNATQPSTASTPQYTPPTTQYDPPAVQPYTAPPQYTPAPQSYQRRAAPTLSSHSADPQPQPAVTDAAVDPVEAARSPAARQRIAPKITSARPDLPPREAEAEAAAQQEQQAEAAPPQEKIPDGAIPYEGGQIAAQVGPHAILVKDIWIAADMLLSRSKNKIPPEALADQRKAFVQQNFRPLLKQLIENKLVYYDATSEIPKEAMGGIEEQLAGFFNETELPQLMEMWQVKSQRELDQKLLTMGMSVHRFRRAFMETAMAQQWIREKIKIDEDINHEQLLSYYNTHLKDFERPSQARWEQLCVRVSKYPSNEAARAALAEMGNQVLDGRPLADVARQRSDGPTAEQGGQRKWTTRGSLVSEVLDRAIFALPIGQLSPIINEGTTMSIVRVLEREEAHRESFEDKQMEIREKIKQQRNKIQQQAYLDELRRRVPVWTMYDDEPDPQGLQAAYGQ